MFYDRADAGNQLAKELEKYQGNKNALILAVPRGGVIIGKIISDKLNLPLDIVITRKISAPGNPEYAIGAVAEQGEPILNEEIIGTMGITPDYLDQEISHKQEEIRHRLKLYRSDRPNLSIKDKTIIIVDDGVATGYSILATIQYLRNQHPKKIVLAIPVIPRDTLSAIKQKVDHLIYLEAPEVFSAVGQFYENFSQVTDEEVRNNLKN